MTEAPLISVVIPTRNRPKLVLRAVSSAFAQTYKQLEVVVVIDGPDVESLSVLRAIQDERLKIVALAENVGGGEARNLGVKESCGEWVAFLDDDDEWSPVKLEKQIALIGTLSNKRAIVSCRFVERSGSEMRTYPLRLPDRHESVDEYMCRPRGLRTGGELLQTSTFLVPRTLMLDVPFARGLKRGQEFIWLIEAGTRGGATLHVHPKSLSFFNAEGFSDEIRISKQPNWRSFYATLKTVRHLFRPGIFAYCIATRLLTDAILCNEPRTVKLALFRDCLAYGGLSPRCIVTFLYIWMMPPVTRRRLGEWHRNLLSLFRAPDQKAAKA